MASTRPTSNTCSREPTIPPAPLITGDALRQVYRQIDRQRPTLVLWGVTGSFPLYWRLKRHPVDHIIDSNPALQGRSYDGVEIAGPQLLASLDAEKTVILLLPFAESFTPDILETIGGFGGFVVIPAYRPEIDGAALRPIETIRADRAATLAASMSRRGAPAGRRATLCYGNFLAGGAERQLTLLAAGLKTLGWTVELVLGAVAGGEADHYLDAMARIGVSVHIMAKPRELFPLDAPPGFIPEELEPIALFLEQLNAATGCLTASYYRHLRASSPDLVIGYTDAVAVASAYAGLLAGTPHIQLSQRGTDVESVLRHYGHDIDHLREHYVTLAAQPGVALTNNSRLGARHYERWIGLPEGDIKTVYNGIDVAATGRTSLSRSALRAALKIVDDAPLVLGVFRLDPEKRPLLFIEVAKAVCAALPAARFVLVGEGRLRSRVVAEISTLGLTNQVLLMGAQADVAAYFGAADLLLHTAEAEGTPNVVLEAGLNGLPVVATRAGATLECLPEIGHAYCHELNDKNGLVASCLDLLGAPALRRQLGTTASDYVRRTFKLDRLAPDTLAASGLTA